MAPNLPLTDLDGSPRIAAGNAISCNAIIDMGAYEFVALTNGQANLLPANINFGQGLIGLGPQNPQPVTLQATQGCVQVHSITATGDYQVSSTCAALFSGNSCTIQVSFVPALPGIRIGSLVVDLGLNSPSFTVPLSGEGLNSGSASPTSLNFGTLPIQVSSPFQSVQVLTAPGVPMQVNSVSITGDFTQFNSCSGQLSTGIACFVDVAFVPTAAGPARERSPSTPARACL